MERQGLDIISQLDHMSGGYLSFWDEKTAYYFDGAVKRCEEVDWEAAIKKQEPGIYWPNVVDYNCMNQLLRGQIREVVLEDEDAISSPWTQQFRQNEQYLTYICIYIYIYILLIYIYSIYIYILLMYIFCKKKIKRLKYTDVVQSFICHL